MKTLLIVPSYSDHHNLSNQSSETVNMVMVVPSTVRETRFGGRHDRHVVGTGLRQESMDSRELEGSHGQKGRRGSWDF